MQVPTTSPSATQNNLPKICLLLSETEKITKSIILKNHPMLSSVLKNTRIPGKSVKL